MINSTNLSEHLKREVNLAKTYLLIAWLAIVAVDSFADTLNHRPNLKRGKTVRGRTLRPTELRGSPEQRIQQNLKAINLGLNQITTGDEMLSMIQAGTLVELLSSRYFEVNRGAVPIRKLGRGKKRILCQRKEEKVFVRKYVPSYVNLLAGDFYKDFRKKLKITSGTRVLDEQILMRTKGSCYYTPYAAEVTNPLEESLHVRGITIDISRRVLVAGRNGLQEIPMSRKEIEWMRKRLIADKLNGVEFEVENQEESTELETEPIEENICYHIVVFPK